jgi:uncharacterized membrane protein YuzA (DUF378 family)
MGFGAVKKLSRLYFVTGLAALVTVRVRLKTHNNQSDTTETWRPL